MLGYSRREYKQCQYTHHVKQRLTDAQQEAMTPEYALLGFLAAKPAHGYELHRQLCAELGDVWHASIGHVYNQLKRMEKAGLVAGKVLRSNSLPAQRQYRLTAQGRLVFDAWLRKPCSSSPRSIRLEFLARLYFAQHIDPGTARDLIAQQREVVQKDIKATKAQLDGVDAAAPFVSLAAQLRLSQQEAVLRWLNASFTPASRSAAPARRRRLHHPA